MEEKAGDEMSLHEAGTRMIDESMIIVNFSHVLRIDLDIADHCNKRCNFKSLTQFWPLLKSRVIRVYYID